MAAHMKVVSIVHTILNNHVGLGGDDVYISNMYISNNDMTR